VHSLEELVRRDPDFIAVVFELFTLSRRNEEIAAEFLELQRRMRGHVAALLRDKEAEGVLRLGAAPDAVADVLFALSDGIALRMLADAGREFSDTISAGVLCVRALLADPA
jgi:hypothetical protein